MRSVNKVMLIGNLTRDPEMRQTPSGQNVTTFGLATNRKWVTKEGDQKDSAEFHECVAWAKLAEICTNYLKKGSLIFVEGYLKTRSWDTPEGVKKFKTEIVVQDMIMLEKKKDSGGPEYVPAEQTGSEANGPSEKNVQNNKEEKSANAPESAEKEDAEEAPTEKEEAPAVEAEEKVEEAPAESESPIDKDLGL
jgi:single-strand DNA-binding protein